MAKIRIIKKYLNFEVGTQWSLGSEHKASAWDVVGVNGLQFWIPKSFCVELAPTPGVIPQPQTIPPTPTAAPLDLDNLLGGDPTFPEAPKPKAKPKKSLGDNQSYLSKWTKGKLPMSGIDHVIPSFAKGTWDKQYDRLIPELDDDYVWNPDVLETLVLGHLLSERILFVGFPGTGKTTAHQQYAGIIKQPFVRINGKDSMESSSFIGGLGPVGPSEWAWTDGTLPMCMKLGLYLCIDEVFKIIPGIQMTMQSVYEKGGSLVLDEKPGTLEDKLVIPDEKFKINATDNVRGIGDNFEKSAATQMQDTSTLDRFGLTLEVNYMPEEEEIDLLGGRSMLSEAELSNLVRFANLVRGGYKDDEIALTLSPRGLLSVCGMRDAGLPMAIAIDRAFIQKLADSSEIAAVRQLVRDCGITIN